jgi:hypothetical protein
MNTKRKINVCLIVTVIALLVIVLTVPAGANGKGNNNKKLHGIYAVNFSPT